MIHFPVRQGVRVIPLLAVFGAFAILCSASFAPASDMDEHGKALANLDDEWSAAAAARDVERVASFYADDAVVYPPNEPVAKGKAAATKVWAQMLSDPSFKLTWKATHAEARGDLGFTAGTYELSMTGPDGKPMTEKGKYLCVWEKQKDGSWKAVHDMWNSDAK
ncbi:hypothetical protein BH09PLA1_BH09PLA1_01950 [soil metagenome]